MIRGVILSTLVAALALPRLAHAQAYDEGKYEPDQGDLGEPEAQAGASADTTKPETAPLAEDFEQGLSPYGDWVDSATYGHVWRPRVAVGWRPYYYGHWTRADDGWFWASDEPWGWATYHYGRWAYDPVFGWIWVPGYQWAPAWVTWRYGPDVIGWAPLFPGYPVYAIGYPSFFFAWTFVPAVCFVGFPVYRVAFAPFHVHRFFHLTHPAPPRFVRRGTRAPAWGGAPHRFFEQHAARPIVSRPAIPRWGRSVTPTPGARAAPTHSYAPPPRTGMAVPRASGFHGFAPMPRGGRFGGGMRGGHR